MFHTRVSLCMECFYMQVLHDAPDLFFSECWHSSFQFQRDFAIAIQRLCFAYLPDCFIILLMELSARTSAIIDAAARNTEQAALHANGQSWLLWLNQPGSFPYSCLYFFLSHSFWYCISPSWRNSSSFSFFS